MLKPDAIIKSNRRSLSITISNEGEIIVHAPKRLSLDKIISFVNDKSTWILDKQKMILEKKFRFKDLLEYSKFMFLGKTYLKYDLSGIKEIELSQTCLLCPKGLTEREILSKIARWYMRTSKNILSERLEYLARLMQLDYNSFKVSNSKNRWGSCDSKGNIKINFRLIMLPHKIIDYVLIHELSHLVEFNHSKKFYKVIESVMPDYQKHRKELKDFTTILQLFR